MKRILLTLSILSISISANCLNLGDIISQVRLLEKDNNSASYRYTDANLIDRVNIIQDEICAKTLCVQNRGYITTVSGTQEYQLPTDMQNITRVAYFIAGSTDAYKKLPMTTIAGQDYKNERWQNTAAGNPLEYYRRTDYIGLVPAPSSTYAGTSYIQLDYNVKAASLTVNVDIPFNGSRNLYTFHQAIIYGVAAMCEYDKGNIDNYKTLTAIYQDWLLKIREIAYTEPDKNLNFTK